MIVPFVWFKGCYSGATVCRVSYGTKEDALKLKAGAEVLRSDWVAFETLIVKVI